MMKLSAQDVFDAQVIAKIEEVAEMRSNKVDKRSKN